MKRMTRRGWLASVGTTAATAAGAVAAARAQEKPAAGGKPANEAKRYNFQNLSPRELIQRRHLPNVELVTQDGARVHFYDDLVKDRRVVIQFMFTRCKDICPVITHHLAEVQALLGGRVGRDIFFYSVTLSPEEDTPKELRAFAKEHGAGPGWTFLTGKPEDIFLLRRSLGFFYDDPRQDADRNNHSGMLVVGTEPLMRWAMCEGGAKPEWIATVIRTEMDAPLQGSVDGVTQADIAIHAKGSGDAGAQPAPVDHTHMHHMK
ncbi:MAG: SCO family protein [Acidobacteriota bacterium]|nr:SCO family protein [Acidobacteriota bacterium]